MWGIGRKYIGDKSLKGRGSVNGNKEMMKTKPIGIAVLSLVGILFGFFVAIWGFAVWKHWQTGFTGLLVMGLHCLLFRFNNAARLVIIFFAALAGLAGSFWLLAAIIMLCAGILNGFTELLRSQGPFFLLTLGGIFFGIPGIWGSITFFYLIKPNTAKLFKKRLM